MLRIGTGARTVTYTDGRGRVGRGEYRAGEVTRGEESTVGRPSALSMAVAPPAGRDRCRFLVEKVAELGIARLRWLRTRHGEGKPPSIEKVRTLAIGALEQSRGAWLTETEGEMVGLGELERPLAIAAPGPFGEILGELVGVAGSVLQAGVHGAHHHPVAQRGGAEIQR